MMEDLNTIQFIPNIILYLFCVCLFKHWLLHWHLPTVRGVFNRLAEFDYLLVSW